MNALANATTHAAAFKHQLTLNALTSPWKGTLALEQQAFAMTPLASNGVADLSMVLDIIDKQQGSLLEIEVPMMQPMS